MDNFNRKRQVEEEPANVSKKKLKTGVQNFTPLMKFSSGSASSTDIDGKYNNGSISFHFTSLYLALKSSKTRLSTHHYQIQ